MENNEEQPIQTEKARELNFHELKTSKPNFKPIIFGVGLLILISLVIFGFVTLNSNKKSSKPVSQKTQNTQATSSAKVALESCSGKESLSNKKQGYESCFPKAWIQAELKSSGLSIGLDPKQADDKFPGTITIEISDDSEAQTTQAISDNSSKFAFGPVKIDGIKGTQVTYTRTKSDPLASYPSGITSVVTNFSRTYTVTLNSTVESFEANTVIYEAFLADFKFIKGTQKPPWSESRNILINTPWIGDSIQSPVVISGEAAAFEGTVSIRIKDSSDHILAQTTTQTTTGQERSPFKASIDFGKTNSKKGTVEVYTVSAKDGSDQDLVSISVVFP